MPALEIRPVRSRRELRAFVSLPWRIYRGEPQWTPPLRAEVRRMLDRRRNAFFEHAEAEYFLAYRDGQAVGRITAQVDRHFNEFRRNEWGLFGFFECDDDPGAAAALLAAAAEWLAARGRDRMVGPMDFTTNDELGILIEGQDRPPLVLCPWTQPYYPGLVEGAGLGKAMDLYMWEITREDRDRVHPAIWEIAAAVEANPDISIRTIDKRNLAEEVRRFRDVYNAAWRDNWGFVPITDREVEQYAKTLKPILVADWVFMAERGGETIATALSLPNLNQVLRHMNGRLLPLGWAKFLWYRRRMDSGRIFALGVKPEHQDTGVAAAIYKRHWDAADRDRHWRWGEMGWTLEVNADMNRALEGLGARVVRRYRLYERALAAGAR